VGWENEIFSTFIQQYFENGTRHVQKVLLLINDNITGGENGDF